MKFFMLVFLGSSMAVAQVNPSGSQARILEAEGQFLSVRLVVGEPIRIFVFGREEAKMNLKEMKLVVRRTKPYPAKILSISRDNNYFLISDPGELKALTDLEVTAELKGRESDTFHFKIKEKP